MEKSRLGADVEQDGEYAGPYPFMPPIHRQYRSLEVEPQRRISEVYYKMIYIINDGSKMNEETQQLRIDESTKEVKKKLLKSEDGKKVLRKWKLQGEKKITFHCPNGKTMFEIRNEAKSAKILLNLDYLEPKSEIKHVRRTPTVLLLFGETSRMKALLREFNMV